MSIIHFAGIVRQPPPGVRASSSCLYHPAVWRWDFPISRNYA